MPHDCPYCGESVIGIPVDTEVEDGFQYSEVWVCPSCQQSFVAEYVFSEYLDCDGDPIPERGDEE